MRGKRRKSGGRGKEVGRKRGEGKREERERSG